MQPAPHNRRHLVGGLAVLAVVLGPSLAAAAQLPEQQKLLARRAAIADAYRKLAEAVYGLEINSTTRVADFVTESDEIRSDVDAMIRGIRVGDTRFYSDGTAEVEAEVTVAKVIETLRESHQRHYDGDRVKTSDFESISRRTEKRVIKALGMGAPREDLPPDVPEGVAEALPGPPPSSTPAIPDIWRSVSPRARLMAVRAARLDAQRMLAERIKGLRLTSQTSVRDFAAESDVINADMAASLVGAEEVQTYYHANELIVEVTMQVPTEQVITTVKRLYSRHYEGDDVTGGDVERVTERIRKRAFEATGMGVPPHQYMRPRPGATTSGSADLPNWVVGPIVATGEGTDPEIDTPQGRLKAIRAAELDAKRKLAEQIAGLRLIGETTVEEFVTTYDYLRAHVDALLVDTFIQDSEIVDGVARVTVGINGARAWDTFSNAVSHAQRNPED